METIELVYSCIECSAPTKYNNGKCLKCYNKEKTQTKEFVPSEGELYLAEYFKMLDIKYKEQVPIVGLINDTKKYRLADFYLEEYNVYVEYNGFWQENKDHYKEKISAYSKNKIPCVYLYPENLGVLDFVFDRRIQQTFIENKMDKELKKYHWYKYRKGEINRFYGILAAIAFGMWVLVADRSNYFISVGLLFVAVYQGYRLFNAYKNIFKLNNYSLKHLSD